MLVSLHLHSISVLSSNCSRCCKMYLISSYKEKRVIQVHSCGPGHFCPSQRKVGKNNRPEHRQNHLHQNKETGDITKIFHFREADSYFLCQ